MALIRKNKSYNLLKGCTKQTVHALKVCGSELASFLTFSFEVIIDTPTVLRSDIEISYVPFIQFHSITSCKTKIQYHNQGISLVFTCTHLCVCV